MMLKINCAHIYRDLIPKMSKSYCLKVSFSQPFIFIIHIPISKHNNLGANATKVTSNGRSSIGFAALTGATDILRILLRSCEENTDDRTLKNSTVQVAAMPRTDQEYENKTPDGMENLLWEEEIIQGNGAADDDEWSKLYMYAI